jgi:uncharacterized protein YlxW (UPF0749 family)
MLKLSLILVLSLVPAFASNVAAEDSRSASQGAEDLRARLLDVQAKESELQARARQLDEELKPENIERSLAGVGSTKPEELRELRRRQLTIEKDEVNAQLKLLATSRERLETAIRSTETIAYQQSADGSPLSQTLRAQDVSSMRLLLVVAAGFVAIVGTVFLITWRRKRSTL